MHVTDEAAELVATLRAYIDREVERHGGSTSARKPAHRVKFHWPPHPVSYSYHVLASDWTGHAEFSAHGNAYAVEVATTPYGVFGRCDALWLEARGESLDAMLSALERDAAPLFHRQAMIARSLEQEGLFTG